MWRCNKLKHKPDSPCILSLLTTKKVLVSRFYVLRLVTELNQPLACLEPTNVYLINASVNTCLSIPLGHRSLLRSEVYALINNA